MKNLQIQLGSLGTLRLHSTTSEPLRGKYRKNNDKSLYQLPPPPRSEELASDNKTLLKWQKIGPNEIKFVCLFLFVFCRLLIYSQYYNPLLVLRTRTAGGGLAPAIMNTSHSKSSPGLVDPGASSNHQDSRNADGC